MQPQHPRYKLVLHVVVLAVMLLCQDGLWVLSTWPYFAKASSPCLPFASPSVARTAQTCRPCITRFSHRPYNTPLKHICTHRIRGHSTSCCGLELVLPQKLLIEPPRPQPPLLLPLPPPLPPPQQSQSMAGRATARASNAANQRPKASTRSTPKTTSVSRDAYV